MAAKNIVLVTGGNAGIGYELTRQLLASPTHHILLGARSLEKGTKAVRELQSQSQPGTVEVLHLDVSSYDSIQQAAKNVTTSHGYITSLVNNAAIATFPDNVPIHDQMDQCFRTNATGPQLMGEAFGPLLLKSPTTARIVNVSSGAGSMSSRLNKELVSYRMSAIHYRASKAALNMVTVNQAVEFGDRGVKVFAYCPGFTVSNLSGMNTAESGAKPTSEGAAPIVEILEGKRDAEHGRFLKEGGQYDW
ncbi:hypothetical protein DOTSEDRAFT_139568 [Dothistroma septosporum NZE10]|uniref:Uncharacterized protein n=1 Tax=Dothistroma septosporum (strain NZE10 / CBS 128990) TaxID=675120 RepID=M2WJ51_DOTSN|nr:hypothetical protein DOTSEDRAFT_139568 [Dothistroma septosporum NZE10]